MKVFVTGASGFVGTTLCSHLVAHGHQVTAGLRSLPASASSSAAMTTKVIGDIATQELSPAALVEVDAVVHLASRVHVMHETETDPLSAFRRINVDGTMNLAQAAAAAGVKRFVFLSSIKVNGESTPERPFSHDDKPAPLDPYGTSKMEAEHALRALARSSGMEVVIIRPPMVYGPKVGANFLRLMRLVDSGIPLPLASINNRRSMVYLGNLVDLIRVCLTHPDAAGETFLAADGEDVSTPELMRRLAIAMGVKARLFSFPPSLLSIAARCIGKGAEADRLIGSLQVDASHAFQRLNWRPPFTLNQGLQETADWYLQNRAQ